MTTKSKHVIRVESALSALSAYDNSDTAAIGGTAFATIYAKYTRGAAGGRCALRIQASPDGTNWFDVVVIDPATLAAGVVDASKLTIQLPVSVGATPEYWCIGQDVSGYAYMRVAAAEIGVPATPGQLELTLVCSSV